MKSSIHEERDNMATTIRKARRAEEQARMIALEAARLAARKKAKVRKLRHGMWQVRSGKYLYANCSSFTQALAIRREIRRLV